MLTLSLIGPYGPAEPGGDAYINAGGYVLEFSEGERLVECWSTLGRIL